MKSKSTNGLWIDDIFLYQYHIICSAVVNHRLIKITYRILDVVFQDLCLFRSQITLRQKPKGVTEREPVLRRLRVTP